MKPQPETLVGMIKKAHEAGFDREEITRRAIEEGYAKQSVASAVSRFFVPKGKRRRAAGAGRKRLAPSPEAQEIFGELEKRYGERAHQLAKEISRLATVTEVPLTLGEIEDDPTYPEGAKKWVLVNDYERNEKARAACIKHYGVKCCVCRMRFEDKYGKLAKGVIQIHHLVALATVGKVYNVNPITDLRPVCPNCHAVIHMRKPAYTPKEVREMLK